MVGTRPTARTRLDLLVVERGLAPSRAEAQALILAGAIRLAGREGRRLTAGQRIVSTAEIERIGGPGWASRAAEKLIAGLEAFAVDPSGLACLDAGASTGGFTDVLLSRGARRVYAVDVGRGQLLERLRRDPRVSVMDETNLRTLEALPEPIDLATLDLSFISLRLVLPAVHRLLADHGRVIALFKPQFEVGRGHVPAGGVVRDATLQREALTRFGDSAGLAAFLPRGVLRSPVSGRQGNLEFLVLLARLDAPGQVGPEWAADVAAQVREGRPRSTMPVVAKQSPAAAPTQQLEVGFTDLEAPTAVHPPLPAPDTMRQIVSIRMPDALVARVESAARARGVSPSALMRALIAAGLDRSYAAVSDAELASELVALRRSVDEIAARLAAESRP